MGRKTATIFQSTEKQVSLSTKIPESLKKDIDELKEKLAEVDPSLTFNVSQIVSDTLEVAVKAGQDELAALAAKAPNGTGAGQSIHS